MTGFAPSAIRLRGISKCYGRTLALAETNLDVAPGTVVGLIGPNGAGKTTLLRIIAALSAPSAGEGEVAGCRLGHGRRSTPFVGLVTERPPFVGHLSGQTNLRLLAGIRGQAGDSEIAGAIELVGLDPSLRKPVSRYSHGMRQRLALAQAIMERPPVLLLDEPTNGLDVDGRLLLRDIIERQADEGAAVILSSHSLSDIEAVCRRIFMVEDGRVRELALPDSTLGGQTRLIVSLAEEPPDWVARNLGLRAVGVLRYQFAVSNEPWEAVRLLVEAGVKVNEVSAEQTRLEDLYREALRSVS